MSPFPSVDASPYRATLTVAAAKGRAVLDLLLQEEDRPAVGVQLTLLPAAGAPLEARTGPDGRALVPLPHGTSHLLIPGRSLWEVVLQHLGK